MQEQQTGRLDPRLLARLTMARDTQRHIVTGRAAIAIYNITSTLMDALRDELKEKFGDDLANNDALLDESAHASPRLRTNFTDHSPLQVSNSAPTTASTPTASSGNGRP